MEDKNRVWDDFEYWSEVLERIPRIRLVEMADELNHRGWPHELGSEPKDPVRREEIRHTVQGWIEVEVGHKALLRYHHLNNLCRTEREFEDWWDEQNAWWIHPEETRDALKAVVAEAVTEVDAAKVNSSHRCTTILLLGAFLLGAGLGMLLSLWFF